MTDGIGADPGDALAAFDAYLERLFDEIVKETGIPSALLQGKIREAVLRAEREIIDGTGNAPGPDGGILFLDK